MWVRFSKACDHGDTLVMSECLDGGSPIDELSDSGTPLMISASGGSLPAVELLLARGANPDFTAPSGFTAFYWALYHTPPREKGATDSHNLQLDVALRVAHERHSSVALRLAYDTDVWGTESRDWGTDCPESFRNDMMACAVGFACKKRMWHVLSAVIRNRQPSDLVGILKQAAINGYDDFVVELLAAGVDPDAKVPSGMIGCYYPKRKALNWAKEHEQESTVRLLMDARECTESGLDLSIKLSHLRQARGERALGQ